MEKVFDDDTLAQNNGKDGKPAYVGYQGQVFDVSKSQRWKNGFHMNRHQAGRDLTADIKSAPHGPEVLERYSRIGELMNKENSPPASGNLHKLIRRFPFLKRHPHPMTVHFPITLMILAPCFNLLFLATGIESFSVTAFHCLGAGLLFTPITILTGFYTWWLNYEKKPFKAVTIKKMLSFIMFFLGLVLFIWRIRVPDVIAVFDPAAFFYFVLLFMMAGCVIVIGWFGASLTFPLDE